MLAVIALPGVVTQLMQRLKHGRKKEHSEQQQGDIAAMIWHMRQLILQSAQVPLMSTSVSVP